MKRPFRKQFRLLLQIAGFNSILFLFIFLFMEISLRTFLGYKPSERIVNQIRNSNEQYLKTLVPEDSLIPEKGEYVEGSGYRERFEIVKGPGVYRIFVFGGSSVAGTYPDYATYLNPSDLHYVMGARSSRPGVFPETLKKKLSTKPVEIINFASPGWSSTDIRLAFLQSVRYDPDIIIIYSGHNDPNPLARNYSPFIRSIENALMNFYSYLYISDKIYKFVEPHKRTFAKNSRFAFSQFRENIGAVLNICEERGIDVILMTVTGNCRTIDFDVREMIDSLDKGFTGMNHMYDERFNQALELFRNLCEEFPDNRYYHYLCGICYERTGDQTSAQIHYSHAEAGGPNACMFPINNSIRELARRYETVRLIDIEAEILSKYDRVGYNLFVDDIHPRSIVHSFIADRVYTIVLDILDARRESE